MRRFGGARFVGSLSETFRSGGCYAISMEHVNLYDNENWVKKKKEKGNLTEM